MALKAPFTPPPQAPSPMRPSAPLRLMLSAMAATAVFLGAHFMFGLPALHAVLAAAAVTMFLGSGMTLAYLAAAGPGVHKTKQLVLLLMVELLFVPLACSAVVFGFVLGTR